MADSTNGFSQEVDSSTMELDTLKGDLESWREVLLPLNKVLHWDKPHYPGVIVGVTSFFFLCIWYFEPSVLTTLSLMCLVICLIDYLVPTVVAKLFNKEWTPKDQRQFEEICVRILHCKHHVLDLKQQLVIMKKDKPMVYFAVVMGSLALLAWVGNCIDNLLLTYLLVCFIVLLPGLRHKGIIQKYLGSAILAIRQTVGGKTKKY